MEDLERHIGSIEGQVDIWKIWKNRWTYGRYRRTGGHMEDMKIWVDM